MAKKIDIDQYVQRAGKLKEEIEALQLELDKEILPVIKRAKQGQYDKSVFGDYELETQRQRSLNKARVEQDFGKKATERVVTVASFAKLGLSKDEAEDYYDTADLPKVYLRRRTGDH